MLTLAATAATIAPVADGGKFGATMVLLAMATGLGLAICWTIWRARR